MQNLQQGASIEDIMSLFQEVNPDIEPTIKGIKSPFKLYRYDKADDRYYFQIPEVGQPIPYLSVTSFCGKSLPTSPFLIKWKAQLGNEVADYTAKFKADYGTFMHIVFTEILIHRTGDFKEISDRAFDHAISLGHKHLAQEWASEIVKDVMGFLMFVIEKNVKVISAEFPIASSQYGLGGCIDLVCELDFNRSRVKALVDFKSGRKGFWETHRLQLSCYKKIWNEWYSDIFPVTHIFNFAPTDWRKSPKYKLENQTDPSKNIFESSVTSRMEIAKLENWINPPKAHMDIVGRFDLSDFDYKNHIKYTDIK